MVWGKEVPGIKDACENELIAANVQTTHALLGKMLTLKDKNVGWFRFGRGIPARVEFSSFVNAILTYKKRGTP